MLYDKELAVKRENADTIGSVRSKHRSVEISLAPIRVLYDKSSLQCELSRGKDIQEAAEFFLKFWGDCGDKDTWKKMKGQDRASRKRAKRQRDLVMAIYSSFMTAHLGIGNCSHRVAFAAFELCNILGDNMRVGLVNDPQRDQFVVVVGPKNATKKTKTWMVYDPLNNPYKLMPLEECRLGVLSLYSRVYSAKERPKLALKPEDVVKQKEMIPRIADFYKNRCPDSNDTDNTPVEHLICGMG